MSSQEETFRHVNLAITLWNAFYQQPNRHCPAFLHNYTADKQPDGTWTCGQHTDIRLKSCCLTAVECLSTSENEPLKPCDWSAEARHYGRLVLSTLYGRTQIPTSTCTHNISISNHDHKTQINTNNCFQLLMLFEKTDVHWRRRETCENCQK